MDNAYQKTNNFIGFAILLVATLVYWITMEPTVSFWDCGEFIAASYKLQVGHQPGAPLFLMIGRMFSLLAAGNEARVAYWINFSSVLSSAATVMFLYWTITLMAQKVLDPKEKWNRLAIILAGCIGAFSFMFSDTFWFSAVEAEVYALSMLFTSLVFWSALKWDKSGDDKWLVFIAFVVGLSIGVHLLSLLVIPAVVLTYYFKKTSRISLFGTLKAIGVSGLIWVFIQYVVIQYTVLAAAKLDIFSVNVLGFGFGYGAILFLGVVASLIAYGIVLSIRQRKYYLNLTLVCISFIFFGFSSYFLIVIRADAKTSLNLSNPDNALSLYNYLGRTNYGDTPLIYGRTFDSNQVGGQFTSTRYRKGANKYEEAGKDVAISYDHNMLFPRIYSQKPPHISFYRRWLNLTEEQKPSFLDNLRFFNSYQLGFMYWRYFLWNFVGKQNDVQGQGNYSDGNWISGIKAIDRIRLEKNTDYTAVSKGNEGYNRYYGLPLILGLAGLFFMYRRNKYITAITITLFFFTGIAIILYLNQDPLQVRERDYAYVGSFYAFAILIGFGVLAVRELFSRWTGNLRVVVIMSMTTTACVPAIMGLQGWNDHNRSGKTTASEWAKNYLNSCAPNAILFVSADNDTFPLWYAQQVEGIRKDIRVVNIQYLGDPDYIDQMKIQQDESEPLPINLDSSKYADGVRDYLGFVDYGIKDSIELKDLLAVLTSENRDDQLPTTEGGYENFLPTRKFKLKVNKEALIKSNTVSAEKSSNLATEIEWDYNKTGMFKPDLILLEILASNDWKRPIYFETNVSQDTYIGLDKYLRLEGYALRLLPFKGDSTDSLTKMEKTNSDSMYDHFIKFDFKGLRTARYLDPESRRVAQTTWSIGNTLTSNLISEGKFKKAHNIMLKEINELPSRIYSIDDTLNKIETVRNLYALKEGKIAQQVAKETLDYVDQELSYIAALGPERFISYSREIQVGFFVLNRLQKSASDEKDSELSREITSTFEKLQPKFS